MSCRVCACILTAGLLLGCSPDPDPQDPDDAPTPSFEVCDALTTQRACFEAGCDFFESGFEVREVSGDMGTDPMCAQGSGFGACLYAPDSPPSEDRLTLYTRTLDDGTRQAVQLGQSTEIAGWMRCADLSIPPACTCPPAP